MVVPVIPKQRQHKPTATKRFNSLINYLQGEQAQEKSQLQTLQDQQELWSEGMQEPALPSYRPGEPNEFSDILDYATAPVDTAIAGEKCIGIRTHGVIGIDTASAEMNAVARMNTRCADPVYHFILSWPEHEKPETKAIFEAAEHAIKSLGFEEHQYVIAVHANTDNIHCHVAMNRVHPITHKSRHIEWAKRTLHYAAREVEIEHGWSHDNGIYVVAINGKGEKQIVLNTKHKEAENEQEQSVHPEMERDEVLPAWHDPESMDSWLKTTVTKALKQDLPHLQGWQGLHAWLERVDITLKDTGGGGLRLTAISHETGEMLQTPMSKGLRFLKRPDLEKRWGPFVPAVQMSVLAPDVSDLTPEQLEQGAQHVLDMAPDNGIPPPPHVLGINDLFEDLEDNDLEGAGDDNRNDLRRRPTRNQPESGRPDAADFSGASAFEEQEFGDVSDQGRGLHGVPAGGMADQREQSAQLLPGALQDDMGDAQSGQDRRVRSADSGSGQGRREGRGRVNAQGYVNGRRERDPAMRAQRKAERAAERDDLRKRFQRYRSFVAEGDTEYVQRQRELRLERSAELKAINAEAKKAKDAIPKVYDRAVRLISIVAIDAEVTSRKLAVHVKFKERNEALALTRMPPLQWREWLYEQSNRGDKAALSALRGIVYQAKRDAKLPAAEPDQKAEEKEQQELEISAAEYSDLQYKRLMARLLEEERKERAIRSNNEFTMRAHEIDALMISYAGIQWRVTGNGNVEYSRNGGQHLFTDRGNRVTFDRERVTDEEIKLALVHSREKFGQQLTLTGEDPVFVHRMARLADDLGLKVLNPELKSVVAEHRLSKMAAAQTLQAREAAPVSTDSDKRVKSPAAPSMDAGNAQTLPERQNEQQGADTSLEQLLQPLAPAAALQGEEALRSMVLSIDPRASFEHADLQSDTRVYVGPLVAQLDEDPAMFAQHIGRGRYVLHKQPVPAHHDGGIVEVRYRSGTANVQVTKNDKERGR